jgi:hypothetical protein
VKGYNQGAAINQKATRLRRARMKKADIEENTQAWLYVATFTWQHILYPAQ